MRLKASIAALCLIASPLFIAPGAHANDEARYGTNEDVAAINDWADRWKQLLSSGDVEKMRDMYTPDAVLMAHGAPRVEGVDAILTFLGRNKARGNKVDIDFENEELLFSGDLAFLTAKYWMTITLPNAQEIKLKGRSFLVFKRGFGGQWRMWRDMDNQAPDVPDAKPAA